MTGLNHLQLETGAVESAYSRMMARADEMQSFLQTVRELFETIDDKDATEKVLEGSVTAVQLRQDLEAFANEFAPIYTEIQNFAMNIEQIKRVAQNQ